MSKLIREKMIEEYTQRFGDVNNILLVDYTRLNAEQSESLRNRLREEGAEFHVVKNSTASLVFKRLGHEDVVQYFDGPIAVASSEDPAQLAKTLLDFKTKNKVLELRGGMVEGKVLGPVEVQVLSTLPTREVLLAQALQMFQAPTTGLVRALNGVVEGLARALNAIAEQKS